MVQDFETGAADATDIVMHNELVDGAAEFSEVAGNRASKRPRGLRRGLTARAIAPTGCVDKGRLATGTNGCLVGVVSALVGPQDNRSAHGKTLTRDDDVLATLDGGAGFAHSPVQGIRRQGRRALAGASRQEGETRGPTRSAHAVVPPQDEPEPALHPKQWGPVTIRRWQALAGSRSEICRGAPAVSSRPSI